tara:strand:+ start:478 stop:609 length:132 start_codon:yes stop_codon:yes gene_type:complete
MKKDAKKITATSTIITGKKGFIGRSLIVNTQFIVKILISVCTY